MAFTFRSLQRVRRTVDFVFAFLWNVIGRCSRGETDYHSRTSLISPFPRATIQEAKALRATVDVQARKNLTSKVIYYPVRTPY